MRDAFRLIGLLSASSAVASAHAIIATTTTDPAPVDTTYSYVGQINGATGIVVGPNKILTAGHVGGGAFTLDGTTYSYVSTARPTPYVIAPGDTTNVDLALVTVDASFSNWYHIAAANSLNVGDKITMVGFGGTGGVSGDGYTTAGYGSGERRKGDNVVDRFSINDVDNKTGNDGVGGGPAIESLLKVAGDAVLAGGDSGGGFFSNGQLVGIGSYFFNETQPDNVDPAKYGNYGFAARNTQGFDSSEAPNYTGPHYSLAPGEAYFGSGAIDLTDPQIQTWLRSQGVQPVPEPGSVAALGLGAMALLRRRRH